MLTVPEPKQQTVLFRQPPKEVKQEQPEKQQSEQKVGLVVNTDISKGG